MSGTRYYTGQGRGQRWHTLRLSNPTKNDAEAWKLWGPFSTTQQADEMTATLNELERTYAANPNYL